MGNYQAGNCFGCSGQAKERETQATQRIASRQACRIISPRREAFSGKNKKEQNWSEKDLDRVFDMWEKNLDLPPQERKSKRQISIETGVPYTTLCERLLGRRGGGHRGKIAGGKHQARILDMGKCKQVTVTFQVGNHNHIPT